MWAHSLSDIHSAGLEGLVKAINKYNHNQNDNFFGYSYNIIRGEIHKEQKREIQWEEICRASSPVEEYEDILFDDCDLEESIINEQTVKLLYEIISQLDSRSRKVIDMHLGFSGPPCSIRQIARELDICPASAKKLKNEALVQIKTAFLKRGMCR